MKQSPLAILVLASILASMLIGCATLDKLFTSTITEMPGPIITNTIFKTNVVYLPPVTNTVTGEISTPQSRQTVTPEISYVIGPTTYLTNYAPRPAVQSAIDGAGALPFPFAGTAALVLGWAYSAAAAFRNRQLNKALIVSVQAGRKFLTETEEGRKVAAGFKERLIGAQILQGVAPQVKLLLDKYIPDHKT